MSNILIVDEEESIKDFLELLLTKEGYKIFSSSSVHASLKMIAQTNFHIIFISQKWN